VESGDIEPTRLCKGDSGSSSTSSALSAVLALTTPRRVPKVRRQEL
jgi:hypothetical protein